MKICIYGAGAVGGFIGARLAKAGNEVSAVDIGPTLQSLQGHGFRVKHAEGVLHAPVNAVGDPAVLGPQELVVVAVKGPALARIAPAIGPLLGPDTIVMTPMNGVPWWFFDGFGGEYEGMRLAAVDPDGIIARSIPSSRVIGCVVHGSYAMIEPGFVHHVAGQHLIIGEALGGPSDRVRLLADTLTAAEFEIDVSEAIQTEIWFKLWGNMTMNPISGLTGATADLILDDPLVNRFCLDIMGEAARIGDRIGCPISQSGQERNALTRKLGAFKTSMLQDVEAGRPVELDALVTVVREIGQKVGVPTPSIDTLLGLARLAAQVRGLYPR